MIRPILRFGAEVLHQPARPVDQITPEIVQLIDDMIQTMYAAPGIGLAAPQVGIGKRIIVVHIGEDDGPYVVVNPVLDDFEGEAIATEGCLSIPGIVGDVTRAEKCSVTGVDRSGRKFRLEAEGLLARCFQHEVDHLDGVLITDKAVNIREAIPVEAEATADDEATVEI